MGGGKVGGEEASLWRDERPRQAVGGRRRGVLVPDPCLSGAAMFTARKEAVSCVCSPLRTEQPAPPPQLHLHVGTERDQCTGRFLKMENDKPAKRAFLRLTPVCFGASVGGASWAGATGLPF